jgi:cysteinyl-tRNA synthetase|tara:strand:+ start:9504 stop:9740 length:237 start_codon:yes stop_codon:yes gene_type:complete
MGNHKPYLSHDKISYNISEYLCTVAGVDNITDISLDEINSYMTGLENFYNREAKTTHNPVASVRNIMGSAVMSTFKGT